MQPRSNDFDEARMSLRFVLTAQVFLVAWGITQATVAPALTGFPYGPGILALTHLLTLGWATATCLGVLAQLLPVLLQQPLSQRGLARHSYWPLALGSALFSWAFTSGSSPWLIAGATVMSCGLLGMTWSFGRTLWSARNWNVTTVGIALALGTLTIQVGAGITLVLNRRFGFWPGLGLNGAAGHALLGLLGWFSILTVALSYRLVAMFTLAHGYICRYPRLVLSGLALSAYGSWLGLWLGAPRPLLAACALLAGASALLWLLDMRTLVRHRVRRRLELPIGMFLLGGLGLLLLSGLAAAAAMGWLPGSPARQIQLIFMLGMESWIGLAIVALLHKIIPFLVWIIRAGQSRSATPAVARDLFSARLARLTLGCYVFGVGLSCAGVAAGMAGLIRVGGGLIGLAGLGLLANSRRAWRAQVTPRGRPAGQPAAGLAAQD
jgi:hypothetical protein